VATSVFSTTITPSGDQSGAADAARINKALTGAAPGSIVAMAAGDWYISAPVNIPPMRVLQGTRGGVAGFDQGFYGTVIHVTSTFTSSLAVSAAIVLLDCQSGGWPSLGNETGGNCGVQIRDLIIDGSTAPPNVDGIAAYGTVLGVHLERLSIRNATGNGIQCASNPNSTGAHHFPDGWKALTILIQKAARTGWFRLPGDANIMDVHVQLCRQNGFHITTGGNSRLIGCRADLSRGHGYVIDHSGAGAGYTDATVLVGCGTERNGQNGVHITNGDPAGNAWRAPVVISGCSFGEDGSNGGAGGGGYAGIHVEGRNHVFISGTTVWTGTVDVAAGCPQYGLTTAAIGSAKGVPSIIHMDTGMLNYATGGAAVNDAAPARYLQIGSGVATMAGHQPGPGAIVEQPFLAKLNGALLALRAAGDTFGSVLSVTGTRPAPSSYPAGFTAAAAGDNVLGVRVSGDTAARFGVDSSGQLTWGQGGASGADCTLGRQGASIMQFLNADVDIATAGKGLRIREGTNAKMGTAVLNGTTEVTMPTTAVTAGSRIFLTIQAPGGTPGTPYVAGRSPGTGFRITSTGTADTSTVAWLLVEPG